jgi:hypothetical protein
MKTVSVRLDGVSPILINRFKEQDEIPVTVKKHGKKDYGTPREQAEKTAYADTDGKLWVPWSWVSGCIRSIASDYKIAGSRKSVKSVSSGAITLTSEKLYFAEGYTLADIEIDSRPAVVQRARIMRHRARLESWALEFDLEIDEDILPLDQVHGILADAGKRAGLGDYRVEKGGPFGKFIVAKWEVIKIEEPVVLETKRRARG